MTCQFCGNELGHSATCQSRGSDADVPPYVAPYFSASGWLVLDLRPWNLARTREDLRRKLAALLERKVGAA